MQQRDEFAVRHAIPTSVTITISSPPASSETADSIQGTSFRLQSDTWRRTDLPQ